MTLAALRRWWPLAAVLVLLFGTALAATRSEPRLEQIVRDEPTAEAPLLPTTVPSGQQTTPPPPEPARGLPDWINTAALVVLGLIVAIILGLLVYTLIRDRRRRSGQNKRDRKRPNDQPRTAEELVAALDAGLEELSDTDRDPRRAVIACWVRLEQAAAAAGTKVPRAEGKAASRTRPARSPVCAASSSSAASRRPRISSARSASSRPASVSRIPRPTRCTSRLPVSASSRAR